MDATHKSSKGCTVSQNKVCLREQVIKGPRSIHYVSGKSLSPVLSGLYRSLLLDWLSLKMTNLDIALDKGLRHQKSLSLPGPLTLVGELNSPTG